MKIFNELNYILNFTYKNQGKLFWECIIFTRGKRLIFSTVFLIISLDCQEANMFCTSERFCLAISEMLCIDNKHTLE